MAILGCDAIAHHNLRSGRKTRVVHHRPGGAVQHALHRANLAADAHAPRHTWPALPCQHVIGELAALDGALHRLHQPVIQHHRHRWHAVLVAIIQLDANLHQVIARAVPVEDPHLKLVIAGPVHGFCSLPCAGRAFAQHGQQLGAVIALVGQHGLDLALADVFPLPGVAAVVQVFAASWIRKEIPGVDALGAWLDAVHAHDGSQARDRIPGNHTVFPLNRKRPLEHSRADACGILNHLAHFAVPIALDQRVFDGLLHFCGRLLRLRLVRLNLRLRLGRVGHAHGLGQHGELRLVQARQWGGFDLPCPVVGWEQHVGHPGAGRVGVGARDVQEHHRPRGAAVAGRRANHGSLAATEKLIRVLIRPVRVVNALVVFLVFSPLFLNP